MKIKLTNKTAFTLCGVTIISLGTACSWLVSDKIKTCKIIKKLQLALAERNQQIDDTDLENAYLRRENKILRNRRGGVSV